MGCDMKKSVLAILGIGAACSVCCLPFVAPLLIATGSSAVLGFSIGNVSLEYVVCMLGPWIVGVGLLWIVVLLVARRRNKAVCHCAASCVPGKC